MDFSKLKDIKTKHRVHLYLMIGIPGTGKTSIASLLCRKYLRNGANVYSNVPIKGAIKYTVQDIGKYEISGTRENPALLILDEAGIEMDNRNFAKNFTKDSLTWWKLYRHFNVDIFVFSQTTDVDLKIRALADAYYILRKSPFKWFAFAQYAEKRIGVDKETKMLVEEYRLIPMKYKVYFTPPAWKMFDSWDRPILEQKQFEIW